MRLLIVIMGHNASGKTTLAKKLSAELGVTVIEGDDFRRFLRERVLYFNGLDFSHPNPKAKIASELTQTYKVSTGNKILMQNSPVIICSVSPTIKYRKSLIQDVTKEMTDVKTIILYSTLPENTLLGRLRARDDDEIDSLGWEKHYLNIKKPIFEEPTNKECDLLLIYNQNNYDEVLSKVKELVGLEG